MNDSASLTWFANSAYGEAVRGIAWLFPALEILHFVGICLLIGSLLLLDLRLLGITRRIPVGPATNYIAVALIGFALCAISGLGFFCSDPFNYASNWAFKLKVVLIVIAGLNALSFGILERKEILQLKPGSDTDSLTKGIAALSLVLWFTVLCLGRLLPYLGGYGG